MERATSQIAGPPDRFGPFAQVGSFEQVAAAFSALGDTRERGSEEILARCAQAYVTRAQDPDEATLFDDAAAGVPGTWDRLAAAFPMARRTADLDVSARFGAIPARLAPLARLVVARQGELAVDSDDHDLALAGGNADAEDAGPLEPGRWSMPAMAEDQA